MNAEAEGSDSVQGGPAPTPLMIAERGTRQLHVLREIRSTRVATAGRDVHSYQKLWRSFGLNVLWSLHGHRPTRLPQIGLLCGDGDHMRVTNGRHRVCVARERRRAQTNAPPPC